MSKKIDILALATVLMVSGFFWVQSCADLNADKVPIKKEAPKAKTFNERLDSLKNDQYARVHNYMLEINGYNSRVAELDSLRPQSADSADIADIKSRFTLGGTMTHRVALDGIKILDKSYSAIDTLLSKNNILLQDWVISRGDEFAILVNPDSDDADVIFLDKTKMAFVGVGATLPQDEIASWVLRDTDGAFDILLSAIYNAIDDSDNRFYTKQDIKAAAKSIITKTRHDLQTNRQKIEHEYRNYYLLDNYSKQSLGIGYDSLGYDALDDEYTNGKYAITCRYTSVYNPNFNPEFFWDTLAKYNLKNAGRDRWYVEKRMRGGKIEKTPVFSAKATGGEYTDVWPTFENEGNTNFEFEMDSISGGRVYFDQIVNVRARKKDWKPTIPQNAMRTIDSLNREIKRKQELSDDIKRKAIEADSIAKRVVNEKFANRYR